MGGRYSKEESERVRDRDRESKKRKRERERETETDGLPVYWLLDVVFLICRDHCTLASRTPCGTEEVWGEP